MSQHPNTQVASGSIFCLTKSGLKKNDKIIYCVSEGKSPSDYETAWSPASPLEFRLFPRLVNPKSWDSGKVGLRSIVDSLVDDHHYTDSSRILLPSPDSKNMIVGSLMRTENPFVYSNNVCQVMKQTLNSHVESDMEISEDYTCVISHGPNPKTTHIYGDEVLESLENNEIKGRCCGIKKESIFVVAPLDLMTTITDVLVLPPTDLLSFCVSCSKKLGMGKDIYMYRGYKAFCSIDCRLEVIHQDEKMEEEEEAKPGSSSDEDLSKKKSNSVIFTVG